MEIEELPIEELPMDGLTPSEIIVDPLSPSAGSPALIRGSGFSPGSEVTVSFDDEIVEISPEDVTVDTVCEFNAEIMIPSEVERREYSISAADDAGNTASMDVMVTDEEPTLHAEEEKRPELHQKKVLMLLFVE